MIDGKDVKGKVKQRASTIRVRTWTLTVAVVVALVLYFLVQVGWNTSINYIDLVFAATIQIITHFIYFPDGELFGQRDEAFVRNKAAYNGKATSINEKRKVTDLREYCKCEYQERRERYIINECGAIGITVEELDELKNKSPKEIKRLERFETNGKLIFFSKPSRKRLYKLLYKPLPVEENQPDTILSAVESDYTKSISDGSNPFRRTVHIIRILRFTVVAVFLAYISYSTRDGITMAVIARIVTYLVSMFTTAVLSFSKGETCSRVHKNKFYIDLSNFIDAFFEWLYREKHFDVNKE